MRGMITGAIALLSSVAPLKAQELSPREQLLLERQGRAFSGDNAEAGRVREDRDQTAYSGVVTLNWNFRHYDEEQIALGLRRADLPLPDTHVWPVEARYGLKDLGVIIVASEPVRSIGVTGMEKDGEFTNLRIQFRDAQGNSVIPPRYMLLDFDFNPIDFENTTGMDTFDGAQFDFIFDTSGSMEVFRKYIRDALPSILDLVNVSGSSPALEFFETPLKT